jgi:hypothetical protein
MRCQISGSQIFAMWKSPIHGIEHIIDKLLQTKSLEFAYESLVVFEASLTLIVDSSDEIIYLRYNFSCSDE